MCLLEQVFVGVEYSNKLCELAIGCRHAVTCLIMLKTSLVQLTIAVFKVLLVEHNLNLSNCARYIHK